MTVALLGRAFLRGKILAETGLHIGAGSESISIGVMDNPVIRDLRTRRPFVPGSSLRGKLRALSERASGLPQNWPERGASKSMHACQEPADYEKCDFCHVFGVPAKAGLGLTRLLVRDIPLDSGSAEWLASLDTDLPYVEVKYEVSIDRITSQGLNPRPIERVPAGAVFGPMEMSFAFYEPEDVRRFGLVLRAMQLLEEDYLGGQGSRGSGKVRFHDLSITCRAGDDWEEISTWTPEGGSTTFSLADWSGKAGFMNGLEKWLASRLHLA